MKLIKDLTDDGIVFYWIDDSEEQLSPRLATSALAKEWRLQAIFDAHAGFERRASLIDRRSDWSRRETMANIHRALRTNPQGRRITDIPVAVDIDLVKQKLLEFY